MKVVITLCTLLVPVALSAQEMQGTIVFREVVNLEKIMAESNQQRPTHPGFEMPRERSNDMALYIDGQRSLYTSYQDPDAEDEVEEQGSMRFRFRMMREDRKIYRDAKAGDYIEERDFMQKKFLIQGPPKSFKWKMTAEQMQVGSYLCMKATSSDSNETVVAWFTPQIQTPLGPAHYTGLPGLVLHVDINDGERTITATDIQMENLNGVTIEKPEKGKEVTREEFEEIVRKKREEMRELRGNDGGTRHIIIRQDD